MFPGEIVVLEGCSPVDEILEPKRNKDYSLIYSRLALVNFFYLKGGYLFKVGAKPNNKVCQENNLSTCP